MRAQALKAHLLPARQAVPLSEQNHHPGPEVQGFRDMTRTGPRRLRATSVTIVKKLWG